MSDMTVTIERAAAPDLDALVPLFDGYRMFYGQASDANAARAFLAERLTTGDSVLFKARLPNGDVAGFTQLYPLFSSVGMSRVWLLNDLFVLPDARRTGIAEALLRAAARFAGDDGAARLELETGSDNAAAQALYRKLGWQRCDDALRFQLPLGRRAAR